jgi:GTP pyrophosphokinase
VIAQNSPSLLKDISEIFMREKEAIVGMSSQMVRGDVHMRFKVEISSTEALTRTLNNIQDLPGVYNARRA